MFADLHLHSRCSDGTYAPEELGPLARRHGFEAMALTDHDTVEGCSAAAAACHAAGVCFLAGLELTTEWKGQEVHLLGYSVDVGCEPLLAALARFQAVRQDRIREIVGRLNQLGVGLEADAVFALANCRSPGRPHVGRALVHAGHCGTLDEAFELYLKKHRPAWVPKQRVSALRAIELVHGAGGLAVIAHPGLNPFDEAIPELTDVGLDGLECYHTKHSPAVCAHYLELARAHGLLVTGGSDCHGHSKGRPTIGGVRLPMAYVEALRERVGRAPMSAILPNPPAVTS